MKTLNEFEKYVIEQKGTERPFTGEYVDHDAKGVYLCKKCESPLYKSEHKFNAHCGWPAFDDEIAGAVKRQIDADGRRVEIICQHCGGHLGHVFEGERLTEKNIRHCVNSVSMTFKALDDDETIGTLTNSTTHFATLGAGCFWCIEAIFAELKGVNSVKSGYSGGLASDANYEAVCSGVTSHAEVIQIEYNYEVISFETLLKVFFDSHDPTTLNRQGNDIGAHYRSVIFAHNMEQVEQANSMIKHLSDLQEYTQPIVTEVSLFDAFYAAESYHNDYYAKHGHQPYCQLVIKPKFDKVRQKYADILKG